MATITQQISDLPLVLGKTDINFMESAGVFLNVLPTLPTQLNILSGEINIVKDEMNVIHGNTLNLMNLTTNYKAQTEQYKNEALSHKNATQTAYQNTVALLEATDIKGTAGYTIGAVDDIVDDLELEEFINFN
jgi:hypothetical protein